MEKANLKEIRNTRRAHIYFIKSGCLQISGGIYFLLKTIANLIAGAIQILLEILFNKHSNKLSDISFLILFYIGFIFSQLLFVVRRRFFHNYYIYNRLNHTVKRTRMAVEGLIYAN